MQAVPPKLIESIVAYRGARLPASRWEVSWPNQTELKLPEWFASVPDWLSLLDVQENIKPFDLGANKAANQYDLQWDSRAGNIYSELKTPAQQSTIDFYRIKLGTSIELPHNKYDQPIPIHEFPHHVDELLKKLPDSGKHPEFRRSFAIDSGNHSIPLAYIRSAGRELWMLFDSLGTSALNSERRPGYDLRVFQALSELRDISRLPIYLVAEQSQIGHGCRIHTISVGKALTRTESNGSYRISTNRLLEHTTPIEGRENFFSMVLPIELLTLAQPSKFIDAHRDTTASTPVRRRNSGRRPSDLNLEEFFSRHQNPSTKHRDYLRRKGLRATLLARTNYYARSLQEHGFPWSDGLTRAFYRQAKACMRAAEKDHLFSLGQDADAYSIMRSALALDDWLAQFEIIEAPSSKEIAPDSIEWQSMLKRSLDGKAGIREQQLTFDLGAKAVRVLPREQIRQLLILGASVASKDEILSLAKLIPWDTDLLHRFIFRMTAPPLCAAIDPILQTLSNPTPSVLGKLIFMAIADGNEKAAFTILREISELLPRDQVTALSQANLQGKTALALALTGEVEFSIASTVVAGVGSIVQDPAALAKILTVALEENLVGHQLLRNFDDLMQIAGDLLTEHLDQDEYKKLWWRLEDAALDASAHLRNSDRTTS